MKPTARPHVRLPRKLLVASLGVAAVAYGCHDPGSNHAPPAVGSPDGVAGPVAPARYPTPDVGTATSGNLMPPPPPPEPTTKPDAGVSPVPPRDVPPTSGNLMPPPPKAKPTAGPSRPPTSGNLMAPTPGRPAPTE
ncbi:MAG: hypothetical protein U0169_16115 [Polyangiaceae bacterium]